MNQQANFDKNTESELISLGKFLKLELIRMDMEQKDLAELLGASRASVNNIINDKYPVSRPIAAGLVKIFGKTPEFWMKTSFSESEIFIEQKPQYVHGLAKNMPGRLSDSRIRDYINEDRISITPLNMDLIQAASIDLTAGSSIFTSSQQQVSIADRPLLLPANQPIRLRTKEAIRLPSDIAGNIGGMARYAKQFIFYGLGYEIDPGFNGHLEFVIENRGVKPFRIHEGMPIITVMFYQLAVGSQENHSEQFDYHQSQGDKSFDFSPIKDTVREYFISNWTHIDGAEISTYKINGTPLSLDVFGESNEGVVFESLLDEIRFVAEKCHSNSHDEDNQSKLDKIGEFLGEIIFCGAHIKSNVEAFSRAFPSDQKPKFNKVVRFLDPIDKISLFDLSEKAESAAIDLFLAAFDMQPKNKS